MGYWSELCLDLDKSFFVINLMNDFESIEDGIITWEMTVSIGLPMTKIYNYS